MVRSNSPMVKAYWNLHACFAIEHQKPVFGMCLQTEHCDQVLGITARQILPSRELSSCVT